MCAHTARMCVYVSDVHTQQHVHTQHATDTQHSTASAARHGRTAHTDAPTAVPGAFRFTMLRLTADFTPSVAIFISTHTKEAMGRCSVTIVGFVAHTRRTSLGDVLVLACVSHHTVSGPRHVLIIALACRVGAVVVLLPRQPQVAEEVASIWIGGGGAEARTGPRPFAAHSDKRLRPAHT